MTREVSVVTSAGTVVSSGRSRRRPTGSKKGPGRGRGRRLPAGIVVVLALMATGLLWAAFAPAGRAADASQANEQVRLGRSLFLSGCSSCHGLEAQGGNQAPSLIGVGAAAVDFQVSTGRMPLPHPEAESARHTPKYTQTQIDQIAAYIASTAPGPMQPTKDQTSDSGDVSLAEGGALFRTNCAQCHQAIGQGGALSYGKNAPNLSKATDTQIYEAMRTGPESMPVFGDGQLNDNQVAAIIKYVKFVTNPKDPGGSAIGHYGPVPEGLVAIVIGLGGLVLGTLWIGSRFS
jgi:ubiquinol-cytochrome c reductase cytochrome c subunit